MQALQDNIPERLIKVKSALQTKKASITRCLKEAESLKGTLIKNSADKEIDPTSYGVTDLECLIKDKAERIRKLLEGLQIETESYHTILEEARLRHPESTDECNYYIAKSSQNEEQYSNKYSEFLLANLVFFFRNAKLHQKHPQGHNQEIVHQLQRKHGI